ncbi:hypothetical protein [Streptomyces sp. NPDC014006]|uniref:hypothetical protein n=1 Tax=Streptomyces sp. NPDC014006 TaxID=3364870 RepID=UPI0036F6472B
MTNPRTVLMQARQGPVPENWRVFTKKRRKVSGFLSGTSDDPDPLLVITPDEVIEYKNERKPLTIVNFCDLAAIKLNATAIAGWSACRRVVGAWTILP